MNKFQSSLVKIFRVILILIVLMILIPVAYICNKSSSKRVQNENRNIHTIYKEGQDRPTYFFFLFVDQFLFYFHGDWISL